MIDNLHKFQEAEFPDLEDCDADEFASCLSKTGDYELEGDMYCSPCAIQANCEVRYSKLTPE